MRLVSVCVCLLISAVHAAVPGDLITALPGFNQTLPSKQYSGYIEVSVSHGRYLHYWLVESENNPATDPVVLWLNGGPGCSSLDGYFYEQGPLHFVNGLDADGDASLPQLELNPYRWNRIANMIFLEAPAGVGFSYSQHILDYITNDTQTAIDNYNFLLNWFQVYPEYANNDFYLSGESYAGVYVPTLAQQIMQGNANGGQQINLKGFMVGNGCTGNDVGSCSPDGTEILFQFVSGHALIEEELAANVTVECPDFRHPSLKCLELIAEMSFQINAVNIYDIYAPCIAGLDERKESQLKILAELAGTTVEEFRTRNTGFSRAPVPTIEAYLRKHLKSYPQATILPDLIPIPGPVECIDGITAGVYLNNPIVREAIHVVNSSVVPLWVICGVLDYTSNVDSLMPIYPELIKNYRVLVFNGDVDACVPYNGNEQWTESLGYPLTKGWHAWFVDNQVAGYATEYDANGFTFITVKGSGHMVPEYKPPQAFDMFQRFLNNTGF